MKKNKIEFYPDPTRKKSLSNNEEFLVPLDGLIYRIGHSEVRINRILVSSSGPEYENMPVRHGDTVLWTADTNKMATRNYFDSVCRCEYLPFMEAE